MRHKKGMHPKLEIYGINILFSPLNRPDLVAVMTNIGNKMANTIWEANLKGRLKPAPNGPR